MSQYALGSVPHNCWFCNRNCISSGLICEECGGATIPSRNNLGKKLGWKIYSFGSRASLADRSASSSFLDAMGVFETQNGTAIRIGNEHKNFILVRHSEHGKQLFSSQEHRREVTTLDWVNVADKDRISLLRFVDEELERGKNAPGE